MATSKRAAKGPTGNSRRPAIADLPDDTLPRQLTGAPDGYSFGENFCYLRVRRWHYRVGNGSNSEQSTVIAVYGDAESGDGVKGAYLIFDPKAAFPKIPAPSYDSAAGMIYLNFGLSQLGQVREVLSLIERGRAVHVYYRDFGNGYVWAELEHENLPEARTPRRRS